MGADPTGDPPVARTITMEGIMPYNPDIHHRRSIRLRGYDYSRAGAYFVTICTHNKECLFGEIVDGKMRVNDAGRAVGDEQFGKPVSGSVPTIIRSFKATVTRHVNEWRRTPGAELWQRNFWEHVIRNETKFHEIRQYIQNNPTQ